MTEDNHQSIEELQAGSSQPQSPAGQLDPAGKSLAEALRISFITLKIIMAFLVIIFLASGFFTVGPDEQALVLRFGKIRGIGQARLLNPGPHWSFPYPIDQTVIIPVKKVQTLPINSFWYFQDPRAKKLPRSLNPIRDGYCITRNESRTDTPLAAGSSDYNIIHCKWHLTYLIDNPELFFRNVYLQDPPPGQSFSDVIPQSISPLLKSLASDLIVTTMVSYSIDEAILSKAEIANDVARDLQVKFDAIGSGLKVVAMQLTEITWPRQLDDAFQASIKASQFSQRLVSEAKGYADNLLNEAGGPVVHQILASLKDTQTSPEDKELLWSHLAGLAQERIAHARSYRTKVAETAKANADYLQKLLPEYRRRPRLVIQKIYHDALESVLDSADEKIILQPSAAARSREVRIQINKEPLSKPLMAE